MTDDLSPANQNTSFTQVMENPARNRADSALARTLHDLECEGIEPSVLADLLFEYLMIEMEPDDPITPADATIWFAQLHRYRDKLQSKIDQITDLYAKDQG